jgi:hypothetical protein
MAAREADVLTNAPVGVPTESAFSKFLFPMYGAITLGWNMQQERPVSLWKMS